MRPYFIYQHCFALSVTLSLALGCGSSTVDENHEENAGGASADPSEHDIDKEPEPVEATVQLGEGVGSAFVPFMEDDALALSFASQAGMEASVSIICEGIPPTDVEKVIVRLVVDDATIGESSTEGESLRFDDAQGRLDTAIPIDVVGHPTVRSVAQLRGMGALLIAEFWGNEELLAEESIRLSLDP